MDTNERFKPAGFVGALAHGFCTQTRWVCLTRWVLGALVRGSLEPCFLVAGAGEGGGGGPKGPTPGYVGITNPL